MTTSTVTSIGKYVQFKVPGKQKPELRNERSKDDGSAIHITNKDHVNPSIRRQLSGESRIDQLNTAALAIRGKDQTLQQISSGIDRMEEALDTVIEQSEAYPPGSDERMTVLQKVNTLRKEIERLTFSLPMDDNESVSSRTSVSMGRQNEQNGIRDHLIPATAEDAQNDDIQTSIMRLKKTNALIRNERFQLKNDIFNSFSGKEAHINSQVAKHKSLFIGKHLGHHPDSDLTTTPSILTGYLN
jgi:hypothetical protein